MATAAERFTEWTNGLRYDDIPTEVREAAKLHLLDTLGCGLAAHALGVATRAGPRWRSSAASAQATVIGSDAGLPAPNAAFANAMLCHGLDFDDTHSDSVSHVSTVYLPGGARRGRGAGRVRPRGADRDRRSKRGRHAARDGRLRRVPPPRLSPDRDLRDLRRGHRGGEAPRARREGRDERARAGRVDGARASSPTSRTAPPTKPLHPAWAAHGALLAARLASLGAEGPPSLARGQVRPLPRVPRSREGHDRPRAAARRPRLALGDPPDRLQALPRLPLHARLARRDLRSCGRPDVLGRGDRGRRRHRPGGGRVARARAGRRQGGPALGLRGEVLAPVLDGRDARPRQRRRRRLHRRGDPRPGRARGRRQGALRDEGLPDLPAGASPAASACGSPTARRVEADFPYQKGGPENPLSPSEVREKFRGNASLALSDTSLEALEEAILALEEHDDLRSALAPLAAAGVAVA